MPFARAGGQATCAPPPDFPASIPIYQQTFENWAREIHVDDLWTCAPRGSDEVLTAVNWAAENGYRVRPRGMMHGWSPLTVTPESDCEQRTILVDTTQHLTGIEVVSGPPSAVRAGAGATMEALLGRLEDSGLGLTAAPAPGDITVAGALAIDAHGTAIPAAGEAPTSGHTYGSLSNLITALTAVVWSPSAGEYVLRRFERGDPATKALLVHLGRAFVTEVELRVGANSNLRCQSFTDITAAELFAPPGSSGRTFASFVEGAGRVEAIWFAFTSSPWLKVWSVSPTKPPSSRAVTSPYNYPFSDNIPIEVNNLATEIIRGNAAAAPAFNQLQYEVSRLGLIATASSDIWGPSKNLLLYVKPTTIRETANGYAVICRRSDIQRVLNDFYEFHSSLLAEHAARGSYPQNMPVEIRVTGVDDPGDLQVAGAQSPVLSALRPQAQHPERDVAVWLDVLTFPGTPDSQAFYREIERWIFANYSPYAQVRPEWSKGWAYSGQAAWSDPEVIGELLPAAYRDGYTGTDDWDWAVAELDRHDPHGVFGNEFLDRLTRSNAPPAVPPTATGNGTDGEQRIEVETVAKPRTQHRRKRRRRRKRHRK